MSRSKLGPAVDAGPLDGRWPRDPVPCDEATYRTLAAQYVYDQAQPLRPRTVTSSSHGAVQVERFEFDSVNGQRVPGVLLMPWARRPRPMVLNLTGLTGSAELGQRRAWTLALMTLLGQGYAVLSIDAQHHGRRRRAGRSFLSEDVLASRAAFVQTVLDCRRALDYAVAHPGVAPDQIGLRGSCLGAMVGTVLMAVEPRIRTAALAMGAADLAVAVAGGRLPMARHWACCRDRCQVEALRQTVAVADPLHFAGRLADRPVLLASARRDELYPPEAVAAWHRAARGRPLALRWLDSTHILSAGSLRVRAEHAGQLAGWFATHLGAERPWWLDGCRRLVAARYLPPLLAGAEHQGAAYVQPGMRGAW